MKTGPHEPRQVRDGIRRGDFGPDDLLWTEGMKGWVRLRNVKVFAGLFGQGESVSGAGGTPGIPPLPVPCPAGAPTASAHQPATPRVPPVTGPAPAVQSPSAAGSDGQPSGRRRVWIAAVAGTAAAGLLAVVGLLAGKAALAGAGGSPFPDFSETLTRERQAEWDRMAASNRTVSELSDKMIDDLENLFNTSRASKGLPAFPVKLDSPLKAYRARGSGSRQPALVREDADALHAKMVAGGNRYFSSHLAPLLSVAPEIAAELEAGLPEKVRYNALPRGVFQIANLGRIPVENLDLSPKIITQADGIGSVDHVLVVPFGLRARQPVPPALQDFAVEALDRDGKVLRQGRIHAPMPLDGGRQVEVKGYLCFATPSDIDRIAKVIVVKKPDEELLHFQQRLRKSLDTGATDDLVDLAETMQPAWGRHFHEACAKSLDKVTPTTRAGIARAMGPVLGRNIDQEGFALLEKLVNDADASVAREAIRVVGGLDPCPQQVIQQVMRAAATRKDDARKDALAFIGALDPAVPENISLFLREASSSDPGIRSLAATFLARAKLEGPKNLELGARFVRDDQEEVVLAGARMIAKQAKSDRAGSMGLVLTLLGNRFNSCRAVAESTFRGMEPFGQADLPVLAKGLEERVPETKCKVLGILAGMETEARNFAASVAGLLMDEAVTVRARAATCLVALHADYQIVQGPLFVAATRDKVPEVRAEAIRTLSLLGRENRVVSLLFDSLADPDAMVAAAGLEGFGNLKPPVGNMDLPVISPRLSSKVVAVRRQAYRALQATGKDGEAHASAVSQGLEDVDPEVVLSSLGCALLYPDRVPNGQKTVERILGERFAEARDERQAVACLEYLAKFGPKAASALPVLERIATRIAEDKLAAKDRVHRDKTVPLLKLVQSIGKESHVLVPTLCKLAVRPQVNGGVQTEQDAKVLAKLILETADNQALRDALVVTGTSGAKAIAKKLMDRDPLVRAFSLLCLESMGKDAQPVMPLIYRCTVRENEKNPAVYFLARLAYGKLQEIQVATR